LQLPSNHPLTIKSLIFLHESKVGQAVSSRTKYLCLKQYLSVCKGIFRHLQNIICVPIGRSPSTCISCCQEEQSSLQNGGTCRPGTPGRTWPAPFQGGKKRASLLILQYIDAHAKITRAEASSLCMITVYQASKKLKKMCDKGLIQIAGKLPKGAYYIRTAKR
jgi:hypothetical protein